MLELRNGQSLHLYWILEAGEPILQVFVLPRFIIIVFRRRVLCFNCSSIRIDSYISSWIDFICCLVIELCAIERVNEEMPFSIPSAASDDIM
jgi:hypothetical protein